MLRFTVVMMASSFVGNIYAGEITDSLSEYGVSPILNASFLHLENPSLGQKTGQSENVYIVNYGANIDLSKTLPVKDLNIHFEMAYIPNITNKTFGSTVGDSIFADPSPYIPNKSELQQFTVKKGFLDNKFVVEVGKSSPSSYFAKPLCNLLYSCQSPLLPSNPSLFSSWGGTLDYKINPEYALRAGGWNYISEFPFQSGWELNEESTGRTYMASLFYQDAKERNNFGEVGLFRRSAPETNPLTGEQNSGYSGFYINRKIPVSKGHEINKTFKVPGTSFFEQFTYSFDKGNAKGLLFTNTMGLSFDSFINSRPMDSYSITLKNYQMTKDKQNQLVNGYAQNGLNYNVDRMQTLVQLDANLFVSPQFIISPYVVYSWNTSSRNSYDFSKLPRDGVGFGLMGIIFLDKFF